MQRWIVVPTPEDAARVAADLIAATVTSSVAERGRCSIAVSGGTGPLRMFTELGTRDLPWAQVEVFQVDERIAPSGDPARNLIPQAEAIPAEAALLAMPVEDDDLEAAAARYAASLPERLDLVQLGVGDDGHTASLVPGDRVLAVEDRRVALTELYRGHRRMTLTYPVLDAARTVLWLATGEQKREPLARLRAGDRSIPAGRVGTGSQIVVCDQAAAGSDVTPEQDR